MDKDFKGFVRIAIGPIRLVRWTKESLVNALTHGNQKATKRGTFAIWSIGIAGYYIGFIKARTR